MLPELTNTVMDYKLPLPTSFESVKQVSESSPSPSLPLMSEPCSRRPVVYLALVDERGGGMFMNAAVEVLSRIVRDLPAEARFGLVTVSDRIGLWDLSGVDNESRTPHISFVDISSTLPLLNLVDVCPLSDLALSIVSCCDIALECVSRLSDACSGPHEGRENYLLEALEGIVDLCIKETREGSHPLPFTGIKILFFLSEYGMEAQNLTASQQLVKARKIDDLLRKCAMWGGISVSFHALKYETSSPKGGNHSSSHGASEKESHSLGLSSIRRLASATGKPSVLPCSLLTSQAQSKLLLLTLVHLVTPLFAPLLWGSDI